MDPAALDAVFPAHAGVSPEEQGRIARRDCFPRTRGGEPITGTFYQDYSMFSPHTRG